MYDLHTNMGTNERERSLEAAARTASAAPADERRARDEPSVPRPAYRGPDTQTHTTHTYIKQNAQHTQHSTLRHTRNTVLSFALHTRLKGDMADAMRVMAEAELRPYGFSEGSEAM